MTFEEGVTAAMGENQADFAEGVKAYLAGIQNVHLTGRRRAVWQFGWLTAASTVMTNRLVEDLNGEG